jgi:GntP family gluconate:H+ symporter
MPRLTACYLLIALVAVILLTDRWRLLPFIALVVATAAFGFAINMSISQIGNLFGSGFALTLQATGLVIVAGYQMLALAEQSGAADRLASAAPKRGGLARVMTAFGIFAGIASTPVAALAVLLPLTRSLGRLRADGGDRLTVYLSLALSAGHGLLLPAPVVVAAMAILGADGGLVLGIGLPLAVVTAAGGAVFASTLLRQITAGDIAGGSPYVARAPLAGSAASRVAAALVIASLVLVILLAIQSLADIPSEPFGGGPKREFLLGLGRPLMLLLVGPGLLLLALNRWSRDVIGNDGWLARGLLRAAPVLLLVGAAGGLQRLLQETGMAELLGERLLPLHLGLLLPFLVAAVIKSLQGSSLVAAITAAGMIQPLLVPLGLDHPTGRALAVLAIGIGAMTVAHINDAFFWLIGDQARLRPGQTLAVASFPMLVQAAIAMALLQIIAAVTGSGTFG